MQDYGPKVNFKRHKVKLGHFSGLPGYSRSLVERLTTSLPSLADFHPVELCNLDYCPMRGSSIDPHRDDEWVWGERLVTVNLLSPTFLTFSLPQHSLAVHIPLPRRSVVVVSGHARHTWLHSIWREHITARRVAITLRELGVEFLPCGGEEAVGEQLLRTAMTFHGQPTNFTTKSS